MLSKKQHHQHHVANEDVFAGYTQRRDIMYEYFAFVPNNDPDDCPNTIRIDQPSLSLRPSSTTLHRSTFYVAVYVHTNYVGEISNIMRL